LEKNSAAIAALLWGVLATGPSAAPKHESSWLFTSLDGSTLSVLEEPRQAETWYTVAEGDVSVSVRSCSSEVYRICFLAPSLPLAVPRTALSKGDEWAVDAARFVVEDRLSDLRLFGRAFETVLVIDVRQSFPSAPGRTPPGGAELERRHTLFFSGADGLIAIRDWDDDGEVLYVAASPPSLGARRIEQ